MKPAYNIRPLSICVLYSPIFFRFTFSQTLNSNTHDLMSIFRIFINESKRLDDIASIAGQFIRCRAQWLATLLTKGTTQRAYLSFPMVSTQCRIKLDQTFVCFVENCETASGRL